MKREMDGLKEREMYKDLETNLWGFLLLCTYNAKCGGNKKEKKKKTGGIADLKTLRSCR